MWTPTQCLEKSNQDNVKMFRNSVVFGIRDMPEVQQIAAKNKFFIILCRLPFCVKNVTNTTPKMNPESSQNRQKRDPEAFQKSTSKTNPKRIQKQSNNGTPNPAFRGVLAPQIEPLEAQIPTWRLQGPKMTKIWHSGPPKTLKILNKTRKIWHLCATTWSLNPRHWTHQANCQNKKWREWRPVFYTFRPHRI